MNGAVKQRSHVNTCTFAAADIYDFGTLVCIDTPSKVGLWE